MRLFDDINYNKDIISKKDSEINLVNDLIGCVDKTNQETGYPFLMTKKYLGIPYIRVQ